MSLSVVHVIRFFHGPEMFLIPLLVTVCFLCYHPNAAIPIEPAFKLRLTRRGLDYVNDVASDILNQELRTLQINNIDLEKTTVSNIRIYDFRAPAYSYTLSPPSSLSWGFGGAAFELSARIRACKRVVVKVCKSLDTVTAAKDVGVHLTVQFGQEVNSSGQPIILSVDCNSSIGQLELRVQGGLVGWIINLFRNQVARKMKPKAESALCRQAKRFILNRVNAKLASFPVQTRMGSTLMLDYGLVSDGIIAEDYIEIAMKAQISQPNATTPASPYSPMAMVSSIHGDRMLYAWASEKMINDILYFAHISNRTQSRFSDKTRELSSLLKFQCENTSKCLGANLPELASMFPPAIEAAEVFFTTTSPPFVRISGNGTAVLSLNGTVDLYASVPKRDNTTEKQSIALSAIDLKAHLQVNVENSSLVGHINISHFRVQVLKSKLDLFTVLIIETGLSSMMRGKIERAVNAKFRRGLPIPITKGVRLVDPKIRLLERTVQVESDLDYIRN